MLALALKIHNSFDKSAVWQTNEQN